MRIVLIHPGAAFSTHDVYVGLKAGLEYHGVEVIPYPLDEALTFYASVFDAAREANVIAPDQHNVIGFASQASLGIILNTQPDAVIAVSAHNWHMSIPALLKGVRGKLGIGPIAAYFTESPYFAIEHEIAPAYDVIFTNERNAVRAFDHPNVHYLAHAFNPAVHHPGAADPAHACDVFYVGSGFQERKDLFRGVDWTGIHSITRGFLWEEVDGAADTNDMVPNEETAIYYRSAAISLNHHRTTTSYNARTHIPAGAAASLNPRAYEIAACGGFMLCDDSRAELRDVFGDAVPTYKMGNSADLEQQIRYFLAHPCARERSAQAAHAAVQPHTWMARAKEMLEILL